MRSFWPIYKRELFAFFVTPLAWVLITTFLFVQGMHFFLLVDHFSNGAAAASDQTPIQAFFGNVDWTAVEARMWPRAVPSGSAAQGIR